jgi:formate dehydrogenase iron-sulfur subunit
MGKSFFVDLTLCTACRGCQVACKQWHKLPAEKTHNWGSHQNPKDLSFITYKVVRFQEQMKNGVLQWLFFPDQCRHCVEPPCKYVADEYDEGAILIDQETGAVIYTARTRAMNDITDPEELCPYNIPRRDPETGVWGKCDMCLDRVHNGLKPACVTSCPTGAMNFGDREDMLELANARLAKVQKKYPDAILADKDDVRVIFLCQEAPENYWDYVVADAKGASPRSPMTRKQFLAGLSRPAKVFRS